MYKKYLISYLALLSFFVFFTSEVYAAAPTSGLVGYWKFDEGSGATISVSPSLTTTYTLTATNSQGNASANTTVTVAPPDTQIPSTPANLAASAISSSLASLRPFIKPLSTLLTQASGRNDIISITYG